MLFFTLSLLVFHDVQLRVYVTYEIPDLYGLAGGVTWISSTTWMGHSHRDRVQFDVFFCFFFSQHFAACQFDCQSVLYVFWIVFEVFQSWELGRWRCQNLQCIFKGNKLGRFPMVLCGCFVWRLCLQFSATRQHYVQPFRLSQLKTFLRWISRNG